LLLRVFFLGLRGIGGLAISFPSTLSKAAFETFNFRFGFLSTFALFVTFPHKSTVSSSPPQLLHRNGGVFDCAPELRCIVSRMVEADYQVIGPAL